MEANKQTQYKAQEKLIFKLKKKNRNKDDKNSYDPFLPKQKARNTYIIPEKLKLWKQTKLG